MHRPNDTIAAIATPPGRGGVGIDRVSRDRDCSTIDHGLALYFPAPHSYTGEDVLELHGHGGTMVLDLVMQRVLALGARAARPGEITERACLGDGHLAAALASLISVFEDLLATSEQGRLLRDGMRVVISCSACPRPHR